MAILDRIMHLDADLPRRGGERRRRVLGVSTLLVLMPSLVTRAAMLDEKPAPLVGAAVPKELQFGGRAELCSAVNAQGVGLQGEYFSKQLLDAPMLTRVDEVIDFDADLGWSGASTHGPKPQSVRWRGWVRPLTAGRYLFHATAPEMRIVIAKAVVASSQSDAIVPVNMVAGRYYPISVELDKVPPSTQRVRLEWTAPQGARFLVPRALLYLPTETVQPRPS